MGKRDPRVDDYIEKAAEFARPILRHRQEVVHEASPDIDETIKWRFPHFMHQGDICHMGAFKQYSAFGFAKAELILQEDAASGWIGGWTAG